MHANKGGRLCLSLSVLVLGLLPDWVQADDVVISGRTFGTTFMVKARDDVAIDTAALETSVQRRLTEIDRRMSTYRSDSEISRFNQESGDDWISVSLETAQLVQRAIEISHRTTGAFDITVGPVVSLWSFGAKQSGGEFQPPSAAQIQATLEQVGHDKLAVRLDPPALRKSMDGVEIDLSAIAKGYAVDAICELLADYDHYMVEIGGEIRTRGSRPLGAGWRIGVEAPTRNDRRVDSVVTLEDEAMATSGDYRNFHFHNGIMYSHTIDPSTGRPVEHRLASVTILADDCATADALATALLVMGPERGREWAEQNSVRALLVSRQGDQLIRTSTSGFPDPQADQATNNYLAMFLVTAVVFGIAVTAMSIGTIIANRRLQGSCGGMAGLKDAGGKTICDLCTKPSPECSGEPKLAEQTEA